MSIERTALLLPEISEPAATQLLADAGLTYEGKPTDEQSKSPYSLYDRARRMTREQILSLRSVNPELLKRFKKATDLVYPEADGFRRVYTLGAMAVLRVFSHHLREPFSIYLQNLSSDDLYTFEEDWSCAGPLTTRADLVDEALNGAEIPSFQGNLIRALDLMSVNSIDSSMDDKLRAGAACTYLAIAHTWKGQSPENENDRVRPVSFPRILVMEQIAGIIQAADTPAAQT